MTYVENAGILLQNLPIALKHTLSYILFMLLPTKLRFSSAERSERFPTAQVLEVLHPYSVVYIFNKKKSSDLQLRRRGQWTAGGLSAPMQLIQTRLVIRPDEQLIVKCRCAAAERRSRAPHVEGNAVVASEDSEETLGINRF